ncbi:MAG: hypothetical protein QXJ59_08275, partial [Thermofilaceae archaeon]
APADWRRPRQSPFKPSAPPLASVNHPSLAINSFDYARAFPLAASVNSVVTLVAFATGWLFSI